MPQVNLIGKGYSGRSTFLNNNRLVNLYPEIGGDDGKSTIALVGTPGFSTFAQVSGSNVIRGMHVFNGLIYFVAGNKLYSVNSVGVVSAQLGSNLTTSTGRVTMADNGLSPTGGDDLVIADGANVYNYDVVTTTWTQILASITASTICFIGGYFVADSGGGIWQSSALYDGTSWPTNQKSTADAAPDNLLSVFANHGELWLFGESTSEIWYQSGSANLPNPFGRVSGGVIDYGCAARYSVAKGANSVFWLATIKNNDSGEFWGVAMANGYAAQKISTPGIEYQMSQYTTLADAFGYCYTDGGHEFYVLTFPTANVTWAFDITTGIWHERSSYQGSMYATGRHVGNCYVYFNGKHYIGDYANSNIYELSSNTYSDNLQPIPSWSVLPYFVDKDGLNNVFVNKFQVDAEAGTFQQNKICLIGFNTNNALISNAGTPTNWSAGTMPVSANWQSMAWNGSVFCAIAFNSSIAATSPDGITWTQRTLPASAYWYSIAWNGSVFCAIALNSTIAATSPDGISWTQRTLPVSAGWVSICWNGSVFCAIANSSAIAATSPDGISWTQRTLPTSTGWQAVAWSGSVFCAVADSTIAATSPDGITWTQRTMPIGNWKGIAWNGSVFCTVASSNIIAATSPDGITWTQRSLPSQQYWNSLCWNGVCFFTVGYGSDVGAISTDGITWQQITLPQNSYWITGTLFQGISYPSLILSYSDDGGNTWSSDMSVSLGSLGAYTTRAIWRQLGVTRGRLFRIACSDAIKKIFISATVDYMKGNR